MSYAVLMLIPFSVVLGVGLFFIWLATRHASAPVNTLWTGRQAARDISPLLSGQLCRWIAIRSRNVGAVQEALGLHNPVSCTWTEGMVTATDRRLFISPPVNGWILVVGPRLPDPSEDVDACFRFLHRLSRVLGEIQFFSVNRVLGHHAWARLDDGEAFRGYAWAGETLWNHGPRTRAERKVGLRCFDYLESESEPRFEVLEQARSNSERVMMLAAIWSVDPTSIDEGMLTRAHGVAGEMSRPRRR